MDIVIQRDGTFDVAEHQTILFTRGAFTFGFREIAKDKLSSLSDWSLTDDSGNRYTLVKGSREPYSFTVTDQGSNYVIYWYFPPTANRSETYTLSYTVHGGLRYYEGGDQLWWQAIYDDRSFPVRAGRVNVTAPAAIQEWAAYINRGNEVWEDARADADASLLENKRSITFEINHSLAPGRAFEVRVEFAPNVVAGERPPWQSRADAEAAEREAAAQMRARWAPILTLIFGALGIPSSWVGRPRSICSGTAWAATSRSRWSPITCRSRPTTCPPASSARCWTSRPICRTSSRRWWTWRSAKSSASPRSKRGAS